MKNELIKIYDMKSFKKEETERVFYEHYFKEVAMELNLKLECFYQPRNYTASNEEKKRAMGIVKRNLKKSIIISK